MDTAAICDDPTDIRGIFFHPDDSETFFVTTTQQGLQVHEFRHRTLLGTCTHQADWGDQVEVEEPVQVDNHGTYKITRSSQSYSRYHQEYIGFSIPSRSFSVKIPGTYRRLFYPLDFANTYPPPLNCMLVWDDQVTELCGRPDDERFQEIDLRRFMGDEDFVVVVTDRFYTVFGLDAESNWATKYEAAMK